MKRRGLIDTPTSGGSWLMGVVQAAVMMLTTSSCLEVTRTTGPGLIRRLAFERGTSTFIN
ncbi:MAG: hypothetical protein V3T92_05180 [Anaerolineae bacterium]